MGESRKARALDDFGLGDERLDHRLERRRAQQHRLLAPARMQQAVGEDVPALGIGRELRFVERDEGEIPAIPGHRLGGAQQPARAGRIDPLLPGDQRDFLLSLDRAHPVVDLAGEQAQGKADRARRMGAKPLDREMSLAGIGRAEHGLDLAVHRTVGGASVHKTPMWQV